MLTVVGKGHLYTAASAPAGLCSLSSKVIVKPQLPLPPSDGQIMRMEVKIWPFLSPKSDPLTASVPPWREAPYPPKLIWLVLSVWPGRKSKAMFSWKMAATFEHGCWEDRQFLKLATVMETLDTARALKCRIMWQMCFPHPLWVSVIVTQDWNKGW